MPKTTLIDCCIKKYAYREVSQIYQELEVSQDGLSQTQIESMREKYGANSFSKRKNDTMLRRLRRAFINPFNIILLVLGIISLATDVVLVSNFARNATTAIIIFSMILISGTIRLVQEIRAKNASKQLNRLIHESVTVRREGEVKEIPAEKLVVGDIVLLSAGDRVPADLRLTKVSDLFLSQAAITGESAILEKNAQALSYSNPESLTQLENLAFMATTVISGKGEGIVLAVGKDTLYGSFAKEDPDAIWAGKTQIHAQYLIANGIKVINGINEYPNYEWIDKIDPNHEYEEVWNRYAHFFVLLDDETYFEYKGADMYYLHLNYEDIKKINIKYYLCNQKSDEELMEKFNLEPVYENSDVAQYIYRIN